MMDSRSFNFGRMQEKMGGDGGDDKKVPSVRRSSRLSKIKNDPALEYFTVTWQPIKSANQRLAGFRMVPKAKIIDYGAGLLSAERFTFEQFVEDEFHITDGKDGADHLNEARPYELDAFELGEDGDVSDYAHGILSYDDYPGFTNAAAALPLNNYIVNYRVSFWWRITDNHSGTILLDTSAHPLSGRIQDTDLGRIFTPDGTVIHNWNKDIGNWG